jgi:hypothetical protein
LMKRYAVAGGMNQSRRVSNATIAINPCVIARI